MSNINFPEQFLTMEMLKSPDITLRTICDPVIGDLGPGDHSTKTDSMQIANSMTNRATAYYPRYNLRCEGVTEIDLVPRSESKGNNKRCPFGESQR